MSDSNAVRCIFYSRTPGDTPDAYRYARIYLRSGMHADGMLHTPHPPAVGDLISLADATDGPKGLFHVLERDWLHPDYGSVAWPLAAEAPTQGPLLTVMVEPSDGMFRDEQADEDTTETEESTA